MSAVVFAGNKFVHFGSLFPDKPCIFRHNLADHPLLQRDAVENLARNLQPEKQEVNSGKVQLSEPDKSAIPAAGYAPGEAVSQIGHSDAWTCLRSIQDHPAYRELLDLCIDTLGVAPFLPEGRTYLHDGFIYVSSPNSVTPFHFDPEYNVLAQIEGEKEVAVFPANDPDIISPEDHERLHATGYQNIPYDDTRFDEKGQVFVLRPGEALYIPPKAAHWVRNRDNASISFSMTWRSAATDHERRVYLCNRLLRRLGARPGLAGANPAMDRLKATAYRVVEKFGS